LEAYYRIEPFGPNITNWNAGMIARTFVAVMGGKQSRNLSVSDFMITITKKVKESTGSIKAKLIGLAKRVNKGASNE